MSYREVRVDIAEVEEGRKYRGKFSDDVEGEGHLHFTHSFRVHPNELEVLAADVVAGRLSADELVRVHAESVEFKYGTTGDEKKQVIGGIDFALQNVMVGIAYSLLVDHRQKEIKFRVLENGELSIMFEHEGEWYTPESFWDSTESFAKAMGL